jgi:hypothetical protein
MTVKETAGLATSNLKARRVSLSATVRPALTRPVSLGTGLIITNMRRRMGRRGSNEVKKCISHSWYPLFHNRIISCGFIATYMVHC